MLVEFRASNFRSLRDQQVLSMVASSRKELFNENTFRTGVAGLDRLTRAAVVYGSNAAGKSNLLRAFQFMQSLIVSSASLQEGSRLPYSPFRLSEKTRKEPSSFEITFIDRSVRYEYGFSSDAERIHSEWLIAYPQGRPQRWFERKYSPKGRKFDWYISEKLKGSPRVWRDATRENALFLSTATQLNSEQLRPVFQWFQKRAVVVGVGPSQFNQGLTFKLLDDGKGKQKLLRFVQAADFGIADVVLRKQQMSIASEGPIIPPGPEVSIPTILRVSSFHQSLDNGEPVEFDLAEESNGTQILLRSAGAWLNVLENGEVLFVDELDTSLHPHMTRFLIKLFHSSTTNRNNAQLIFTTHDTSLLDGELFRRDQVWFIEKDSKSCSRLYPLTDFSPRKDEALERGYLRGRYGAIPFIGELHI